MSYFYSIMRQVIAALVAATFVAVPVGEVSAASAEAPMLVAQADCYAIGQQVAAQNGGTLARATLSNQGGQPVCVIVVLVPGKDGQRPRRAEFVVPAN